VFKFRPGDGGRCHHCTAIFAMLDSVDVTCPYCGEAFEALIEPGDAGSAYIQDCEICCNPIQFHLEATADAAAPTVTVAPADEV
jgi:hypothetical protein